MKSLVPLLLLLFVLVACSAQEVSFSQEVVLEEVTLLNSPWGISFVDENYALVTEKQGRLALVNLENGSVDYVSGVPSVVSSGQGGLLDVEFYDGFVYLTYSASDGSGASTYLGRGLLDTASFSLNDFEVLFVAEPHLSSGAHFGSRVVFDNPYVFVSVGDRGSKDFGEHHHSQNLNNSLGAIHRIYLNGSIPNDNPFVGEEGVVESIFSYGHRNNQGMTLHPVSYELWVSEHGEQDGDSIRVVSSGDNHGWPLVHTGCTYVTGRDVGGDPFLFDEFVNPIHHWECKSGGFPPSGMTFYTGSYEPWHNNLFVGNLRGQYLGRFVEINGGLEEQEPVFSGSRVRDVEQSPDGLLYFVTDDGLLYRIVFEEN